MTSVWYKGHDVPNGGRRRPAGEADPVGGLAVGGGGAADREVTAGVVAAARGWAAAPAGEADPVGGLAVGGGGAAGGAAAGTGEGDHDGRLAARRQCTWKRGDPASEPGEPAAAQQRRAGKRSTWVRQGLRGVEQAGGAAWDGARGARRREVASQARVGAHQAALADPRRALSANAPECCAGRRRAGEGGRTDAPRWRCAGGGGLVRATRWRRGDVGDDAGAGDGRRQTQESAGGGWVGWEGEGRATTPRGGGSRLEKGRCYAGERRRQWRRGRGERWRQWRCGLAAVEAR